MEPKSNEWEATQRKNVRHLAYWASAWVLTIALASFGPKFLWDHHSAITIAAILISTIVGVGFILMNRTYTNGLDEMQRKVMMDAKAIALGVGVIGGLSYSMLDIEDIIPFNAEIGHLVMLMSLTYVIAVVAGSIRYK